MSFKRDGDSSCLLNKLKHQRVIDLLGSYIPEEEAKLLSNGRLSCLVCNHKPIFDTVKMLVIHRQGKRHLQELSRYIESKSYMEIVALKKEKLSMNPSVNDYFETLVSESPNLLVHNSDYFSMKLKRKFSDRRKTLELPSFINEIDTKTKLQDEMGHGPSPSSQVRYYLKQLPKKTSLEKSMLLTQEKGLNVAPSRRETSKKFPHREKSAIDSKKAAYVGNVSQNIGSGWIKDKYGNWIKDLNAEFDSDDDTTEPQSSLPNPRPPCDT